MQTRLYGLYFYCIFSKILINESSQDLIEYILDNFSSASLSVAVLFVKPRRVNIPVKQYYAYEIESDDLLIGYGMPWDNKYHNRPNIVKLLK